MVSRKLLAVSLLIVMSAAPVCSQQTPTNPPTQPPQQDEIVRVGTAAVQMDVIVTDKSGRRIKGLTATEFQILDEGSPQTVDYCNIYR